jgi:hypothetical protein
VKTITAYTRPAEPTLDQLAAELGPTIDDLLRTDGTLAAAYYLALSQPEITAAYIREEYPWRDGPITPTEPAGLSLAAIDGPDTTPIPIRHDTEAEVA